MKMNGKHPKACPCADCARVKFGAWQLKAELLNTPRLPTSVEQVVPVRAHYRRQPNFASKSPKLRSMVVSYIRTILVKE